MRVYEDKLKQVAATAAESMRNNRVPGLAMALISRNRPAFTCTIGLADPNRARPVSEDTYFEAASLTKPFFARLVFELCDEGIIELTRPLIEYEPDIVPSTDARFLKATAADVLCHATGLQNWGRLPMELRFATGEGFGYSGMGYYYLQQIIEKLTETRLDALLQQRLMDKLGMDSAAMIWTGALRHRLARTADENGDMEPERSTARHSMGMEPNAAFSLYVTIKDYPKFIMGVLNEPDFARRVRSVKNSAGHGVEWGLGWGLYKEMLWHWGDNGGFKSLVCLDPDTKDALLIHTNGFNGLNVCFDIAQLVTGESFADIAAMIAVAE